MKKTYIIPTLQLTYIGVENLIADSLKINSGTEVTEQYVKENNSSRSDYNVWDDDWSK